MCCFRVTCSAFVSVVPLSLRLFCFRFICSAFASLVLLSSHLFCFRSLVLLSLRFFCLSLVSLVLLFTRFALVQAGTRTSRARGGRSSPPWTWTARCHHITGPSLDLIPYTLPP
jgi:hypothetical protein